MSTTTDSNVDLLTEWLAGPQHHTYQKWTKDLQTRFPPTRFTGTPQQDQQARKRVSALLSSLKELRRLSDTDWQRFKALGDHINKQLARYRYTPRLGLDRPTVWTAEWSPEGKLRRTPTGKPKLRHRPKQGGYFFWTSQPHRSSSPLQELRSIRTLEAVVRNNWLDSLRPCVQCSRWFIARKPWTKLCGAEACRVAAKRIYQTSETYRAKRRKNP